MASREDANTSSHLRGMVMELGRHWGGHAPGSRAGLSSIIVYLLTHHRGQDGDFSDLSPPCLSREEEALQFSRTTAPRLCSVAAQEKLLAFQVFLTDR